MVTRDEAHASAIERGHGDQLAQITALMDSHRAKLREVIAIVGHDARPGMLGTLLRDAKAALRAIEMELDFPSFSPSHGTLGLWGVNGHGPRIDGMLNSARLWAAREKEKVA